MPVIRQDLSTREWTIFSVERAKRPKDFIQRQGQVNDVEYMPDCPFCRGNEHMTPAGTYSIGKGKKWEVMVIPNKFPALIPSPSRGYKVNRHIDGPYLSIDGIGSHEVIIESPRHNYNLANRDYGHIEKVLHAYRQRFVELSRNENYQLIIIFKNHGPRAGTSLEHPHSQLIATPFVPSYVRNKLYEAQRYFDDFGRCVYCNMLDHESRARDRVVAENEEFIAFAPYASMVPYHLIILPKRHQSCFIQAESSQMSLLAHILGQVLGRLYDKLNNPDYNYVLDSSPADKAGEKHYHWHLEILPRLSTRAGFEIGSGMHINSILPEDCAKFLSGNG